MKIALIILLCIVVLVLVGWPIVTHQLEKRLFPNAKPLTDEELKICERIVRERKGYPYVCRLALKYKRCPCSPCKKIERDKSK